MKSILKKTLGVLICLTFLPIISIIIEAIFNPNPNYLDAIMHGGLITIIVIIGGIIGWQVGKLIAWCFKKD